MHQIAYQCLSNCGQIIRSTASEKGCCPAYLACDQHPFSGILVQWCIPPYSVIFESLDTVSVEFLSCISRLQKVPGTNFITQWDVLVHLLLTYYSVTLLKTILSCRFIYLLHLPNSHQWICLRLITSSQIPIVIL